MTPEEIQATESAPPIGGVPCPFYVPWSKADPNPLATDECLEFSAHDGFCHEAMSPFSYQPCPWSGYPEGPGLVQPHFFGESALAGPVGVNVARLLGLTLPPPVKEDG